MKGVKVYGVVGFLILLLGCVETIPESIGEWIEVEYQGPKITYLVTKDHDLGIEEIASQKYKDSFKDLKETIVMRRDKTYWVRLNLEDITLNPTRQWVMSVARYTINNLYMSNSEGDFEVSRAGEYDPVSKDLELLYRRYHRLRADQLIDGRYLYLQLREVYFPQVIYPDFIQISTFRDYREALMVSIITSGHYYLRSVLFLGGILFMLIYTSGIYFIHKDRLYLLYGAYLVFILMYLGVKMYPGLSTLLFGKLPALNFMWNEVTQVMLNFWYTRFVRNFIEAEEYYPWLHKAAIIVEKLLLGCVALIIINMAIEPVNTIHYYIVGLERTMMIVFSLAANIYVLTNLKDRRGLIILAGSVTLLTGSVLALVMVDIQYFMVGVTIEMFIFGMGLGILMKRREEEKNQLSKEIESVKMKALQTQMNPHFIFNSLNSIRAYMISNKTKEASEYLSKFSRLIRQTLEYSTEQFISLQQELKMLELYVHIEQLRFREQFGFQMQIEETLDTDELLVPPLIVQPFMENGIWHGLMQKKGEKRIQLDIKREGNYLHIILTDNGIGREASANTKSKTKKKSMAIDLTSKRIELLQFEKNLESNVQIEDLYSEDGTAEGTRVKIKLPIIQKEQE